VEINFGDNPEVVLDFADVESLERLRDAAEGRGCCENRIEENQSARP
jgi:hypothetical protein